MAKGFEVSARISRSPDEVWAVLTDWRRAPDWMNGIDEMRALDEGPAGEGTRLVFRARGAARETTIVAWRPPTRLALRSRQGGMTAIYDYSITAVAGSARLTLRASCEAQGLGWRLASPLIGFLMKRSDSGQLEALKRLLESPSTRAG